MDSRLRGSDGLWISRIASWEPVWERRGRPFFS